MEEIKPQFVQAGGGLATTPTGLKLKEKVFGPEK